MDTRNDHIHINNTIKIKIAHTALMHLKNYLSMECSRMFISVVEFYLN